MQVSIIMQELSELLDESNVRKKKQFVTTKKKKANTHVN